VGKVTVVSDIDYGSWEYEDLLRQAMRFETILRRDFRDDQPQVMAELEHVKTELAEAFGMDRRLRPLAQGSLIAS
jgi:hypothetical protein